MRAGMDNNPRIKMTAKGVSMKSWQDIGQIVKSVELGNQITAEKAANILKSNGANLTAYIAGAHHLKEKFYQDKVQLCSIINAKSGLCSENCAFCAQSAHHSSSPPAYPLKSLDEILAGAQKAQEEGSHCYGIVTSGTSPEKGGEFETILKAIKEIRRKYTIEPSASLGILDKEQAAALAEAGCVTYHHNLETARSFFSEICTTHDYEEDVETVRLAKSVGMKVCCGGILGLGETPAQRIELAKTLSDLDVDSVPLNFLNPIEGTPLEGLNALSPLDCVRAIVMFRYFLPSKPISVCGGREANLRELQSWMFIAGASGTMIGNYLTTSGRDRETDLQMLSDLEVQIDAC